jgi:hypothetical protein
MKKNTLLESIQRMHQIIGIKPDILMEEEINEANALATEAAKLFSKIFTNLEKSVIVGSKTYTQSQVKKIIAKAGANALNADEKMVLQTLSKELIAADKVLIKNLSSEIFGEIQKLGNRQLKTKYFSEVKAGLRELLPDTEVAKVVKNVDDKLLALKPNKSTPTPKPEPKKEPVLTPDPDAPNSEPLKFDDLPPNANDIINATAKSSTEAAAFMQQVDLLGFNDKITTSLKINYSQYYKKSPAELIEIGNDLARMLNEKTYGPWKRMWSKIAANPSLTIEKTGRAAKSLLIWVVILSVLSSGAIITFALRDKIMKTLGLEDESLLPDVSAPDLSKKDDSNKQTSGIDDSVQGLRNFFKQKYDGYDDTAVNALDIKSLGSSKYEVTKDGTKLTFTYSNGTFTRQ